MSYSDKMVDKKAMSVIVIYISEKKTTILVEVVILYTGSSYFGLLIILCDGNIILWLYK